MPSGLLRRVADIYIAAINHGLPPTRTVHKNLGCSYSHASRLVGRARAEGLLSPTQKGKATR